MMRNGISLILTILSLIFLLSSNAFAVIVYDLADDWSDVINPNAPWSYNSSPGQPITNHVDDWNPTNSLIFESIQPAWAESSWPNENHVPMWFKRISDTSTLDVPTGYVGMHGTEADDPDQWVGAAWTSPNKGMVDISGGVWQSLKTGSHVGRNSDWQIRLNNTIITSGNVSYDDSYSSNSPYYFNLASAGAAALNDISVEQGDVISLEFKSHTTMATFVGIQFTITQETADDPPVIDIINYNGCISELCTTTLVASAHDPAGGTLTYEWDLDDDGSVEGTGDSYVFDPPVPSALPDCDPYFIKLTVTSDASGLSIEEIVGITVKLAGDANGDGVVNIIDKVWVRNAFGSSGENPADVNCDNVVNIIDKVMVRNQFGQSRCGCP